MDFAAIDFETANYERGSPCAVGLAIVRDGAIVDSGEVLIWQDYVDPFNTSIHGITEADIADAPHFSEVWPVIESRIGGLPLVAHNAAFDTGVLRDALDDEFMPWPEMTYACTLVMGRRTYDLPSYRLPFVADAAGVDFNADQHHRAEADAVCAARIMLDIARRHDAADLDTLARAVGVRLGRIREDDWHGCTVRRKTTQRPQLDINVAANPDNPLYGQGVTFTGALSSMTRKTAWGYVEGCGGVPLPEVSKRTNLLVFGHQDASKLAPGADHSAKFRKAMSLRAKGFPVEIIGEDDFLAMLRESEGLSGTRKPGSGAGV